MPLRIDRAGRRTFVGTIDIPEDRQIAAKMATACAGYRIDEDDEDYLDGARSCFNCRYRRWLAEGFSCAKDFPTDVRGCD